MFPKDLTVEATTEDIIKGIEGSCEFCPIALAVKRIVGPDIQVSVFRTLVRLNDYSRCAYYELPLSVTRFIDEFDKSHFPRKPKTITIELSLSYTKDTPYNPFGRKVYET